MVREKNMAVFNFWASRNLNRKTNMKITKTLLMITGIILLTSLQSMAHGTGSDHTHTQNENGIESAKIWLNLIDTRKYNVSWQTAAPVFKTSITALQWEKAITNMRNPLGNLIERNLFHDQYTTTLPGMPDGEYIILRFVTKYKNKQSAVETVTLMKDQTANWRVAGYFIK